MVSGPGGKALLLRVLGFLPPRGSAPLGVCTEFSRSCPSSERVAAVASPRAARPAGDPNSQRRSGTARLSLHVCPHRQRVFCYFPFSLRSVVL